MVAVGMLVLSVTSAAVGPFVSQAIRFDDRDAVTWTDMHAIKTNLAPGEPIMVTFVAHKRSECYPPDGHGEVEWRYYYDDGAGGRNFVWLIQGNDIRSRPDDHQLVTPRVLALPVLVPGKYAVQLRAMYWCKRASPERTPQIIDSPLINFEVRAG